LNVTKPRTPFVAHDVACRIIMLKWAADCHGWRQRPWWTTPMVSGLFLLKKIGRDVELAHILVLDGNFPQKGTIAIFIVTVM
jgi:hypothetical protein